MAYISSTLLLYYTTLNTNMHVPSSSVLLAAALTGFVAAKPVDIPGTKQAFSVQQVASGEKVAKAHPAKALLAVYQKYGAVSAAPAVLKKVVSEAAAPTVSGSATAIPASTYDEVSSRSGTHR